MKKINELIVININKVDFHTNNIINYLDALEFIINIIENIS